MKRAALMMVGLIAVTGCASAQPHLNQGTIVEKEYKPSVKKSEKKCTKWKSGKTHSDTNCTSWKTSSTYKPECWQFEIQHQGKEDEVCVSRIVYQSYKVGDQWHG